MYNAAKPYWSGVYELFRLYFVRPGMYSNDGALNDIETMIWGYEWALIDNGLLSEGDRFTFAFRDWLGKSYELSCASGWAYAIHDKSKSISDAQEQLKIMLSEFKDQHESI